MTYNEFIQNIIDDRGQWNIPKGEYFEAHHIIPRCMGGDGKINKLNDAGHHSNIIYLYPREHYIAHKLLAEENPDNIKLRYAFKCMCIMRNKSNSDAGNGFVLTEEEYETARLNYFSVRHTQEAIEKIKQKRAQQTYKPLPEFISLKVLDAGVENIGKLYRKPEPKSLKDTSKYVQEQQRRRDLGISTAYTSGEHNGMYGKGYLLVGGNNGHASIRYFFKGLTFESRKELIEYLTLNNYKITSSAIRIVISGKGTKIVYDKYKEVFDNLTWEYKHENNLY